MSERIKLLKNNQKRTDDDLSKVVEFYDFLTGESLPAGLSERGRKFKLSEKKAFEIIWYLQEHLSVFPDTIERCCKCGCLYDSDSDGFFDDDTGKCYCETCR